MVPTEPFPHKLMSARSRASCLPPLPPSGAALYSMISAPDPRSRLAGRGEKASAQLLVLLAFLLASTLAQAAEPPAAPANPPAQPPLVATNASADMAALDDKYRLHVGDCLSFRIVEDRFRTLVDRFRGPEDRKDPKLLVVAASGDLEVPYIGRYPAADKTCKQLAREIQVELEKDYYHRATVILAVDLLTKTRGSVYLTGQLRVPGAQDIPGDEVFTLSKAIMRAGGFTEFGDGSRVRVTRKSASDRNMGKAIASIPVTPDAGTQVFLVDVSEILAKGRAANDLTLEPGDLVYVPRKLW